MKTFINAVITIENGKLVQIDLNQIENTANEPIKKPMNDFQGLLMVQSIINDAVNNFERENQRSFIPDEKTIYNIPKDV